jgi:4-alpha-glucanotransferase
MSARASIVHLAGLVGIEAQFTDALGQDHQVSDEALLALIGAFGLPADPAAALRALGEEERQAPLGLGPIHLVHAEAVNPELPLRPPAGCSEILWTCRLEDGEERTGQLALPEGQEKWIGLPLPAGLPLGYHRLELDAGRVRAQLSLIVAPSCSYLPDALAPGARSWGLTCQLYGLRSENNWGMGDFTDLARLAGSVGVRGAATLGINPLHALFAAEPLHSAPYSPSSRIWLNYLYIDPTAAPGFAEDETVRALMGGQWFGATRYAARSADFIDYGAVAACKRAVLEALFRRFRSVELSEGGAARTHRGKAFRDFQHSGGRSLADFAIFEALHEHYSRQKRGFCWQDWARPMRNPRSAEVAGFAGARRDRVEFFQFLQWEADRQLAAAAAAGRQGGLSIGLYRDLAVGACPNGAEAWADQQLVAPGASIGAPPDVLNRSGQNWGLAPVNPLVLRRQGFAPFIASLRANMRHAGILRIDHVMSLNRLYWIPSGMAATAGAYVSYPFDDLLRIVALESHRQTCAVIGEDLGTVPDGFREKMRSANVLSYRVLVFERRGDGDFARPDDYPPLAAATVATHDIATLKGYWLGRDIEWRRNLDLYPDAEAAETEVMERRRDRRLLLEALVREGLLASEDAGHFFSRRGEPVYSTELTDAILTYLAKSRARLMLVQLEDVVGESEQANLPGTIDEHPNWRRRMSLGLEETVASANFRRVTALILKGRRHSAKRQLPAREGSQQGLPKNLY